MAQNGNYAVSQVMVRQSPQLGAAGRVMLTTTVTFMVGDSGPFTFTWDGAPPSAEAIVAVITAQVQQLQQVGQGIDALNKAQMPR